MHVDLLNSWKEIATYLGRGVRTAQRWEEELHLPVHRPRGRQRSAVTAFKSELDHWIHNAGRSANGSGGSLTDRAKMRANLKANRKELHILSTRLCEQMLRTHGLLHETYELTSKLHRN
jgi:hypothetical protein